MSWPLTENERYALDYLYGGDRDVKVECHSAAWVITRYKQKCVSCLHKGKAVLRAGTRMVVERARVDGYFGSCYTCEPCIKKAATHE